MSTLDDDVLGIVFGCAFDKHGMRIAGTLFAVSKAWARWLVSKLAEPAPGVRLNRQQVDALVRAVLFHDNIFLSGGAGTGKSFVLRAITRLLYQRLPNLVTYSHDDTLREYPRTVHQIMVGAPTGTAAEHCRGRTLHSLFKIGSNWQRASAPRIVYQLGHKLKSEIEGSEEEEDLGDENDPIEQVATIKLSDSLIETLRRVRVLVIDEISMTGKEVFELMDECLQIVKGIQRPFGGVQLLFVGDFLQLSPVRDKFAFTSSSWAAARLHTIDLVEILRADPNERRFMQLLGELRFGRFPTQQVNYVMASTRTNNSQAQCALFRSNTQVKASNAAYLSTLSGMATTYTASDVVRAKPVDVNGAPHIVQTWPTTVRPPKSADLEVELKVGAVVMCTANVNRLGGCVLSNGTQCRVLGLHERGVRVVVLDESLRDTNRELHIEPIAQREEKCVDDVLYYWIRTQLPFRLGYARTIHKAQGSSIFVNVDMDLATPFYGQLYVALSRVSSPSLIRVINPDFRQNVRKYCKAHPVALGFYATTATSLHHPLVAHVREFIFG